MLFVRVYLCVLFIRVYHQTDHTSEDRTGREPCYKGTPYICVCLIKARSLHNCHLTVHTLRYGMKLPQGAINLPGGGPSVCDGRSPIFSGPCLCMHKKFWSPFLLSLRNWPPPLRPHQKFLSHPDKQTVPLNIQRPSGLTFTFVKIFCHFKINCDIFSFNTKNFRFQSSIILESNARFGFLFGA